MAKSSGTPLKSASQNLDTIEDLMHVRNFLLGQFDDCTARLSLYADETIRITGEVSENVLLEERDKMKCELIVENARRMLQDDVLKLLLHSQAALKAIHSGIFSENKEDPKLSENLRSFVCTKLVELQEINKKISKTSKDLENMRRKSHDTDLTLQELIWANKERMVVLQNSKKTENVQQRKLDCEKNNPEIQTEKTRFENEVKKLRCIKHVFQSLIHGAKVDWFEDEELCELVIKLGEETKASINVSSDL